MIRFLNIPPLLRLSFQILIFSIYLVSRSHGQEEPNSGFVREQHVNELKRELVQIKKDLQTLQPNNERPAVAPALSPTIPEVSSKKVSPNSLVLKRTAAIIEVKDDLHLIRQGLLELQAEKTTEPSKQKISIESNLPARSIIKVRPRGNYFLFINPGIAFTKDREFAGPGGPSLLSTHTGTAFSMAFGGQLGPWTIGPEISFRRLAYKKFIVPGSTYDATGDSNSYSLALYGGYDLSFKQAWNIHTAISIGISKSDEKITLTHYTVPTYAASGSHFQGSIRMALEYAFSDLCAAHIGYRFTYLNDLREFDSMPIHQAELGLRLNL